MASCWKFFIREYDIIWNRIVYEIVLLIIRILNESSRKLLYSWHLSEMKIIDMENREGKDANLFMNAFAYYATF